MVKAGLVFVLGAVFALSPISAEAHPPDFRPGAPGAGDPYYPLDGNGGYDVRHYTLDLGYDPPTDTLTGVATITARATQDLSRFDLDLDGLTVREVKVDGRSATWSRDGQELVIVPARGLRRYHSFTVVVRYDGVPETINDLFGISGFIHTDDGQIIAGQPHGAATWFPANDHPIDKASYTFNVTAPNGLEVIANGVLVGKRQRGPVTRWRWDAREPMASYLATVNTGDFDVDQYRADGIRYWDAIDPDLSTPFAAPRTGSQFALSQSADSSYKRLSRTIDVPDAGTTVSFQITRDTEPEWDFAFVEAHTVSADDWTTLPDTNGNTSQDTGMSCSAGWLEQHPFLAHYQTFAGGDPCTPSGTTGQWWARSGTSDGYESWNVDLAAYAGSQVELSISYASDSVAQLGGLFVDDVVVSTGAGTTSFEDDGDTLDGWTVAGAPEGSPGNENDWIAGGADLVPTTGDHVQMSLDRQPEIIGFLADTFGRYPFRSAGAIVPDDDRLGSALETQTRPIYAPGFFGSQESGDSVIVHELAHQWFGDSLALARWKDIWLNEGFASYAEWLWSEREGLGTAQEIFDGGAAIPADDPFWSLVIGDPGPDHLFDSPVYNRGAMTLHALRLEIGDRAFFRTLRWWFALNKGGNVATDQFIRLAERVSGEDLGAFFTTWVYTGSKPPGIEPDASVAARSDAGPARSFTSDAKRFGDGRNWG
jgi:hypothetical protein